MKIKVIPQEFAVCKIKDISKVDFSDEFYFIGKTDEEISLVCCASRIPENATECDSGWKGIRIEGVLDFSLVGILSKISSLLAENQISIFAISTYNTDYILIKNACFEKTIDVLRQNGYQIVY